MGWVVKESACKAGDPGLIPGSGRSPGGGRGDPLQYSCLENPMGRGAWQATVHGSQELDKTARLKHHQWGKEATSTEQSVFCLLFYNSQVSGETRWQASKQTHA